MMSRQEILDILYDAYLASNNFSKKPIMLEEHFLLSNIGLTSLSSLVLLLEIETRFGIKLDLITFSTYKTVGGLVSYIELLLQKKQAKTPNK